MGQKNLKHSFTEIQLSDEEGGERREGMKEGRKETRRGEEEE